MILVKLITVILFNKIKLIYNNNNNNNNNNYNNNNNNNNNNNSKNSNININKMKRINNFMITNNMKILDCFKKNKRSQMILKIQNGLNKINKNITIYLKGILKRRKF